MSKEFKNYISEKGFSRLQAEFEFLSKQERPEVTKLVTWAASNGDRSENADYHYGKKRLREIDRRIRYLTKAIAEAVIVPIEDKEDGHVRFGATVKLCNSDKKEKKLTIVGRDEIDTKMSLFSWLSPLCKALIGKSLGDEVEVQTPLGTENYEITEITYKPWQ